MSLDFLKSPVFMRVCAGCANGNEATSSVDPENEWMLQHAIQELTAGKTVVMIAHKIKTIMNAGQIIVMDNGRVHGIGTHEALLQSDEIYRTFWDARRTASQWKI